MWGTEAGLITAAAPWATAAGRTKPVLADAFEALVRQNRDALYRGAYRLTGNHEDAQDLLQEALVEAYAAFGRFQLGTHFTRWVMRIMTRTFIDRTRRRPPFV